MLIMECFYGRPNEVVVMGQCDGEEVIDRIIPITPVDPTRRTYSIHSDPWEIALKLGQDHGWVPRGVLETCCALKNGVNKETMVHSMNYTCIAWGCNAPAKMSSEDAGAWADALELVLKNPATWPVDRRMCKGPGPDPIDEVIAIDCYGRVKLTVRTLRGLITWLRRGEFDFAMDD